VVHIHCRGVLGDSLNDNLLYGLLAIEEQEENYHASFPCSPELLMIWTVDGRLFPSHFGFVFSGSTFGWLLPPTI
jgi:hypothetical protein